MTNKHYILEGKKIKAVDLLTWGKWMEVGTNRIVKQETLPNGLYLSTVFLGLDYNFGDGEPILFETMVFKGRNNFDDIDCDRYTTWDKAEAGHEKLKEKHEHDSQVD